MAGLTVGELDIKLTIDKKGLSGSISSIESEVSVAGNKISKGWAVSFGLITTAASKAFDKVGSIVSGAVSTAIKRVDTMNNSTKVFEAMGYASEDVSKSMDTLKGYLDGLPTSMTDAVSGVQSLSASFGGIEKGTEYFMAMNNAGLAFGSTSDQISSAITQLSQTSLDGPLDAATWNSLQNSGFQPVFAAMADQAGMTVGELKESFGGNGTKTVQEFLDSLVQLDKEGAGSMKSLSEIAKENTAGIGTALENVQNRAGKAIGKIIDSIGSENISGAINAFSASFDKVADVVVGALQWIGNNSEWLVPIIGGLVAAFATYEVITNAATVATNVMATAQKVLNAAMNMNPVGIIIAAVVGLITALVALWNNCEGFRNFIAGVLDGIHDALVWLGETIDSICKEAGDALVRFFNWIGEGVANVGNTIKEAFQNAWNFVVGLFTGIGNFFRGVWDTIVGIFSSIGTAIGDAVSGAFKAVVNGILGFVEGFINAPVRAINALIGVINAIPGINLGYLNELKLPRMAQGGIVPGTSYSGDRNLIMANSGEMVITRQQQAALWDAIESGSFGDTEETTTITNNRPIQIVNNNEFNNETDFDTFNNLMLRQIRQGVA